MIQHETPRIIYTVTSSNDTFSIPFSYSSSEIKVIIGDVLTSNYIIDNNNIILNEVISDTTLTIYRDTPITNGSTFVNGESINTVTASLDKLTKIAQDLDDKANRSPVVAQQSGTFPSASMIYTIGQVIAIGNNGFYTVDYDPNELATIVSFDPTKDISFTGDNTFAGTSIFYGDVTILGTTNVSDITITGTTTGLPVATQSNQGTVILASSSSIGNEVLPASYLTTSKAYIGTDLNIMTDIDNGAWYYISNIQSILNVPSNIDNRQYFIQYLLYNGKGTLTLSNSYGRLFTNIIVNNELTQWVEQVRLIRHVQGEALRPYNDNSSTVSTTRYYVPSMFIYSNGTINQSFKYYATNYATGTSTSGIISMPTLHNFITVPVTESILEQSVGYRVDATSGISGLYGNACFKNIYHNTNPNVYGGSNEVFLYTYIVGYSAYKDWSFNLSATFQYDVGEVYDYIDTL